MSELHKFLFDGLPVRGMLVRLTDAWTEILRRRASNSATGAYPDSVRDMLGEMVAASALMQANIKFDGALILQILGDGPVKVAVAEVQPDLALRATATVVGDVCARASLRELVNARGRGRCAITLDLASKRPGQQPYQGIVPLVDGKGQVLGSVASMLEHYMLQSEQLDTTLVLAANDQIAAGLLIQRLPMQGQDNLSGSGAAASAEDQIGHNEAYNHLAILARSLQRDELLTLDADTILRRLFWEQRMTRFEPQRARFACTCSRERVGRMIQGLGQHEVEQILQERDAVEVACEFCGLQYHFDPVDAAQLFLQPGQQPPGSDQTH